jgi:hypothetical protein
VLGSRPAAVGHSFFLQNGKGNSPECTDDDLRPHTAGEAQRAKISIPTQMTFAQKSMLAIDVDGHHVQNISISWQSGADGILAPVSEVKLQRAHDGSAFIEVAPPGFGSLQLEVAFVFEDCVAEQLEARVRVPIPEREPDKLVLAWTNWRYVRQTGTAHLDLANPSGLWLIPLAYYEEVDSPVPVPRGEVEFTVIRRKNLKSAVALLGSSSLEAVELGQAVVKATFQGKSAYLCIDVTRDAALTSGHSDCQGLVQAGVIASPVSELPSVVLDPVDDSKRVELADSAGYVYIPVHYDPSKPHAINTKPVPVGQMPPSPMIYFPVSEVLSRASAGGLKHADPTSELRLRARFSLPKPQLDNACASKTVSPDFIRQVLNPNQHDLAMFIHWLRLSGFTDIQKEDVELDYRPVSFTGTVAVTEKAFRTQIYSYLANPAYVLEPTIPDQTYYVNATNFSVPATFAQLVEKIGGLDARPFGGVCNNYAPARR